MEIGTINGPPVVDPPIRLPSGENFDFEGIVNEEADRFQRATGQDVPKSWRDLLVTRVLERPEVLEEWFAQGRTTPEAIRQSIEEQFEDAWEIVRSEPKLWDEHTGAHVEALVKSIQRRCRFVFWCWGQ